MAVTAATTPRSEARRGGIWSRVSAALWRRPWARATIRVVYASLASWIHAERV